MRRRKRLRFFDLAKIEQGAEPLSPTEQEVRERLTYEVQAQLFAKLDLDAALQILTPRQRDCFLLYAEGKTYREIARTLSLGLGPVQRHIATAREKLKKILRGGIQTP